MLLHGENHGDFGAGEGGIVFGAVDAARIDFMHQLFFRDLMETQCFEEGGRKRQNDNFRCVQRADAFYGCVNKLAPNSLAVAGDVNGHRLDFDRVAPGRGADFRHDLPGHDPDNPPVLFCNEKAVDVLDDITDGARYQLLGEGLDQIKDALGVLEFCWSDVGVRVIHVLQP